MKKLLALLVILALVVGFAACGGSAPPPAAEEAAEVESENEEPADEEPMDEEPEVLDNLEGKSVAAFVLIEDQFQRMLQQSMQETLESFGANVIPGFSGGQLDQEVTNIHNALAAGVDGIAIFPVDPVGSVAALTEAAEQGVMIFGVNMDLGEELQVGWAESDQFGKGVQVGEVAREYLLENFDEFPIRMAVMQFHGLNTVMSDARTSGFMSKVYDLVEIIVEVDDWMADTAINTAAETLVAHPDIQVWWWANEGAAVGSVMAQRNAGVTIPGFTIAMSEQIAYMLLENDGNLIAANGQDPVALGRAAGYNLAMALMGRDSAAEIRTPGILMSAGEEAAIHAWLEEWRAGM